MEEHQQIQGVWALFDTFFAHVLQQCFCLQCAEAQRMRPHSLRVVHPFTHLRITVLGGSTARTRRRGTKCCLRLSAERPYRR